jgi:hypothetical protein
MTDFSVEAQPPFTPTGLRIRHQVLQLPVLIFKLSEATKLRHRGQGIGGVFGKW